MNYLCKTQEGKTFVMKDVKKDWNKYVGTSTYISLGGDSFKVIQPIEIHYPNSFNEVYFITEDKSLQLGVSIDSLIEEKVKEGFRESDRYQHEAVGTVVRMVKDYSLAS
jgi:hypothetical protein